MLSAADCTLPREREGQLVFSPPEALEISCKAGISGGCITLVVTMTNCCNEPVMLQIQPNPVTLRSYKFLFNTGQHWRSFPVGFSAPWVSKYIMLSGKDDRDNRKAWSTKIPVTPVGKIGGNPEKIEFGIVFQARIIRMHTGTSRFYIKTQKVTVNWNALEEFGEIK